MYLIILEDNEMVVMDDISVNEKNQCYNGYLNIVDMSNNTQYYNGQWHTIEKYENK